jgi:hypothetical protein
MSLLEKITVLSVPNYQIDAIHDCRELIRAVSQDSIDPEIPIARGVLIQDSVMP